MHEISPVAPHDGLTPAVSWATDGSLWLVYASHTTDRLLWQVYAPDLTLTSETVLEATGAAYSWPRLSGEWLITKSGSDAWHAILRNLVTGERRVLDEVADGNWPVAIDATRHAVQSLTPEGWSVRVTGSTGTVQYPGAPDGLLTVDQLMKDAHPDWYPQTAGAVTVRQGPEGGVLCRWADGWECWLWVGQETFLPVVADGGTGTYAVATWGGADGVRLAAVTRDDFVPPPMPPTPAVDFALDAPSGPAPCTVTARLTTKVGIRTHRWLIGVTGAAALVIDGADTDTHTFAIRQAGRYDVAVRAQPLVGDVLTTPRQLCLVDPPAHPQGLRRGCQTGFGAPIVTPTDDVYHALVTRGWFLARVKAAMDAEATAAILQEVEHGLLEPLVIVTETTIASMPPRTDRLKAEFYNEPDIGDGPAGERAQAPPDYVRRFRAALPVANERGLELHVGGISNPDPPGLVWLRQVLAGLPPETPVCYHRYARKNWDVAPVPRAGYGSRAAEFAAIRTVTGARRLICSEFGWHQSKMKQPTFLWFTQTRTLSDQEIRDRLRMEFTILEAENRRAVAAGQPPIYAAVWFQVWEGVDDRRFGLMRQDRSWKPQADLLGP